MNSNIFPVRFEYHLIFCIVSLIFFLVQYYRQRYKYQVIMAATVPFTMLIYASTSKIWFYGIGILTSISLIICIVLVSIEHRAREKQEEKRLEEEKNKAYTLSDQGEPTEGTLYFNEENPEWKEEIAETTEEKPDFVDFTEEPSILAETENQPAEETADTENAEGEQTE